MKTGLAEREKHPVLSQLNAGYRAAVTNVILDLGNKGLLGEHQLSAAPALQTTVTGGVIGQVSGNLFHISGFVQGEMGSEPMLTFAWKPTNADEMYVSGVPASKVTFKQRPFDALDQKPVDTTAQFLFHLPHFLRLDAERILKDPSTAITTIEYQRPDHS